MKQNEAAECSAGAVCCLALLVRIASDTQECVEPTWRCIVTQLAVRASWLHHAYLGMVRHPDVANVQLGVTRASRLTETRQAWRLPEKWRGAELGASEDIEEGHWDNRPSVRIALVSEHIAIDTSEQTVQCPMSALIDHCKC
jgi:hypothetical protein